jgi:hypothetical protein
MTKLIARVRNFTKAQKKKKIPSPRFEYDNTKPEDIHNFYNSKSKFCSFQLNTCRFRQYDNFKLSNVRVDEYWRTSVTRQQVLMTSKGLTGLTECTSPQRRDFNFSLSSFPYYKLPPYFTHSSLLTALKIM